MRTEDVRSANLVALRRLDERTDDRALLADRLLAQFAPIALASLPDLTRRSLTATRTYASLADFREPARRVATIVTAGVTAHTAGALGLDTLQL